MIALASHSSTHNLLANFRQPIFVKFDSSHRIPTPVSQRERLVQCFMDNELVRIGHISYAIILFTSGCARLTPSKCVLNSCQRCRVCPSRQQPAQTLKCRGTTTPKTPTHPPTQIPLLDNTLTLQNRLFLISRLDRASLSLW